MHNFRVFGLVLMLFAAKCVPLTWSSNINSIFTTKTPLSATVRLNKNLIESIAHGAQIAMDQCKEVFKWDKWNCPESSFSRRQKQTLTREMAYVEAILSAGVVHAVTRNCSRGDLDGCGCDPARVGNIFLANGTNPNSELPSHPADKEMLKSDWLWGGCSDFPDYGELIAKNFLDNLKRGQDIQAYAHLHNNFVGRQIIRNKMLKRCKCHGVSGSCSLQTCWMEMVNFHEVAKNLKELYNKAVKIDLDNENRLLSKRAAAADSDFMDISKNDPPALVYVNNSPNYCIPDRSAGWSGTKGRSCSKNRQDTASIAEKKSCKNICRSCGHRVRKQKKETVFRCNCEFQWCCEVKCQTCTKITEEFFCE